MGSQKSSEFKITYDTGIDLQNRRIYMLQEIEQTFTTAFIMAINAMNDEDRNTPIEVHISSEGGEVASMFSMYDVMRQSDAPIHTFAHGEVCSAAVLILAAGTHRFASENSWLMHHSSFSAMAGDEKTIEDRTEVQKRQAELTYQLMASCTTTSARKWKEAAAGETWLSAEEMVEWGVVDEVIPSPPRRKLRKRNVNKPTIKKGQRKKAATGGSKEDPGDV